MDRVRNQADAAIIEILQSAISFTLPPYQIAKALQTIATCKVWLLYVLLLVSASRELGLTFQECVLEILRYTNGGIHGTRVAHHTSSYCPPLAAREHEIALKYRLIKRICW